jgi:hypothetical protein
VVGLASPSDAPLAGLALLLTLVGGLSAYMIRQPATATLRIRQGRGRQADRSLALGWAAGFALVALLCLLGLLALGAARCWGWPCPSWPSCWPICWRPALAARPCAACPWSWPAR